MCNAGCPFNRAIQDHWYMIICTWSTDPINLFNSLDKDFYGQIGCSQIHAQMLMIVIAVLSALHIHGWCTTDKKIIADHFFLIKFKLNGEAATINWWQNSVKPPFEILSVVIKIMQDFFSLPIGLFTWWIKIKVGTFLLWFWLMDLLTNKPWNSISDLNETDTKYHSRITGCKPACHI